MPPKCNTRSGLTGIKTTAVFDLVLELEKALLTFPNAEAETQVQMGARDEAQAEADARAQEAEKVESEVENLAERLEKILTAAAIPFSSMTLDHSHDVFHVLPDTPEYFLSFKTDRECKVIAANKTHLGTKDFWNSSNLHAHLNYLMRTVPQMSEASARLWIDTLFFRASAIICETSATETTVLHLEASVPSSEHSSTPNTSTSGIIGYVAMTVPKKQLVNVLQAPQILSPGRNGLSGFFTAEAKPSYEDLAKHLPQALAEQYACAIQLGTAILRGVLTDGQRWIFTIVKCNPNGGAIYRRSHQLNIDLDLEIGEPSTVRSPGTVDIIVAILADSIRNTYVDIQSDECFVAATGEE
ncbi:hypothetical protein DFH09DRAFT_1316186 [Mycena vulgaris]|nr:hypothetical protein DFH09DRAFT_1316186 [Mycena vulgaris]